MGELTDDGWYTTAEGVEAEVEDTVSENKAQYEQVKSGQYDAGRFSRTKIQQIQSI